MKRWGKWEGKESEKMGKKQMFPREIQEVADFNKY